MAKENFEPCMAHIFASEGGFVNHPQDPGGATNYGITIGTLSGYRGKPVTIADVRALTRAEAAAIYRRNYWDKVRGDDLPAGLDLIAFDAAVNSGVNRGIRWLQMALGVAADGVVGPKTLEAARGGDPAKVIARAIDERELYLRNLKTWATFGRGWSARLLRVEASASAMAVALPPSVSAALSGPILEGEFHKWIEALIASIVQAKRGK